MPSRLKATTVSPLSLQRLRASTVSSQLKASTASPLSLQKLTASTVSSQLKAATVSPPPLQRSAEFLRLRALSFRESPQCFLTVASHVAARAPSFLESSTGLCADVVLPRSCTCCE